MGCLASMAETPPPPLSNRPLLGAPGITGIKICRGPDFRRARSTHVVEPLFGAAKNMCTGMLEGLRVSAVAKLTGTTYPRKWLTHAAYETKSTGLSYWLGGLRLGLGIFGIVKQCRSTVLQFLRAYLRQHPRRPTPFHPEPIAERPPLRTSRCCPRCRRPQFRLPWGGLSFDRSTSPYGCFSFSASDRL